MEKVIRLYRMLNILSIDVALGAIAGAAFFANVLKVPLRPAGLLALGLTVWIIYTADHLVDAARIPGPASTKRHRFHQRNFKELFAALAAGLWLDFMLLFFVRRPVIISGIILFGGVLVYFLLQRRLKHYKELVIAVLYTCGILLPALSLNEAPVSWQLMLLFGHFGVTAFINLLIFSQIEQASDAQDGHHSLVTLLGDRSAKKIVTLAFSAQTIAAVSMVSLPGYRAVELVVIVMNMVLALVWAFPALFTKEAGYRLAGDGVFLLPFLYLLIR